MHRLRDTVHLEPHELFSPHNDLNPTNVTSEKEELFDLTDMEQFQADLEKQMAATDRRKHLDRGRGKIHLGLDTSKDHQGSRIRPGETVEDFLVGEG